jgi:hypothetical protein
VANSRSSRPPKKKAAKRSDLLSRLSPETLEKMERENRDRARMKRKARKWARTAHPNVVRLVNFFSRYERLPHFVSEAPFWPRLRDSLSELGALRPDAKKTSWIDTSFHSEALGEWAKSEGTWGYLVYSDGLAHGKLWTQKHATTKELSRLKSAVRDDGWWIHLRDTWETDPAWTPAHRFLSAVRGKEDQWYSNKPGKPPLEHDEFKKFWECFTSADLEDPSCSLYHPKYTEGFVDGALNLSGGLKNKFSGTNATTAQKRTTRKRSKAGR